MAEGRVPAGKRFTSNRHARTERPDIRRQAFVGLQGSLGSVTMGRQFDAIRDYFQQFTMAVMPAFTPASR